MSAQVDQAFAPRIGILAGSDSHNGLIRGRTAHSSGNVSLAGLLPAGLESAAIHVTRNHFRQSVRYDLGRYDCLLNLVSDPDINPGVLDVLTRLLRGYRGRVVNHPDAVKRSGREKVAARLAGLEGVRVPRTLRLKSTMPNIVRSHIEKAGLVFPVIARVAGTHEGRMLGLFDSIEEMQPHLVGSKQHIVTEFVNFQSADSLYRKYRVFYFGHRRVLRHLLISDGWNVHAADRVRFMSRRPDLIEEERRLFADTAGAFPQQVRKALIAIGERMELDFFGLDFGLTQQGKVLLFEANAAMSFFPFLQLERFPHVTQCLEPARRALAELLGFGAQAATSSQFEVLEPVP